MRSTMRLIHVLAETGYSGGEFQLEQLIAHLQEQGHENHVVVPRGAKFVETCKRLGVPVHTAQMRRPWMSLAVPRLRRIVRQLQPDLVHFGCGRATLWGGLSLVGMNGPVKVSTRRIDYPIRRSPIGSGRYCSLIDHAIANCRAVEKRLLDAGVPQDRVTMIHEGILADQLTDVREHRDAARNRLGLDSDAIVVSCAATLRPRKGQRILIEAFQRLVSAHPKAVLVLAGEGSDRQALEEFVTEKRLGDHVRLPGRIQPVKDLHAASDVAVMASYNEGLSNACLEAAAAGLPLVVSDVGGLPEIVEHGASGYVAPAGDLEQFIERLDALLGDAELRLSMGEVGRQRIADRFTVAQMVECTESLFERLVDRRAGGDTVTVQRPGDSARSRKLSRTRRSEGTRPGVSEPEVVARVRTSD